MAGHVFISYSRRDTDYVGKLVEHLRTAGLPVWVDHEINYGDQWETVVRDKVDTCAVFVPVMSPESERSAWVRREINRAEATGKPILPLLLAGEAFFRLSDVHYEDVRNGELPAPRFVTMLRHLLGAAPDLSRPDVVDGRVQRTRLMIVQGIDAVAGPIRRTLGPRGQGSVIRCADGTYRDLKTAREIAEHYAPDSPYAEPGVNFVRDLVRQILADVGDGAATAVVLGQALVAQLIRELDAGASPEFLERGINAAAEHVLDELARGAREVETKEQIFAIVTSAVGDRRMGEIVAEAMDKVGKDGAITVEENIAIGLELELSEGMRFGSGFLSASFVTDESRQEVVLEDPYILICDSAISSVDNLLPVLEKVRQTGRPILVVAPDVNEAALATLVVNATRDTLRSVAVKAPGFGTQRREILRDMAIQTGGVIADLDVELSAVDIPRLGAARRVVVTKDQTTIIEAVGGVDRIQDRVDQIRAEIERTGSDYEREKLVERLARLAGGVAVIRFSGHTAAETAEVLNRCELAVEIGRRAVDEGILPGGGAALVDVRNRLMASDLVSDDRIGARALIGVLAEPMAQIVRNADGDLSEAILSPGFGVDATDLAVKDMTSAGIIDVAGTTKAAVSAAVALASRVLRVS